MKSLKIPTRKIHFIIEKRETRTESGTVQLDYIRLYEIQYNVRLVLSLSG